MKRKEYGENNKDTIRERQSKKETCLCGTIYTHQHKARHERSLKHQQWLHDLKTTAETI